MKKWNTVCISMLLINLISLTFNQSLFDNLDQSAVPPTVPNQQQLNPGTPEPILQPKMTTTINEAPEDQVKKYFLTIFILEPFKSEFFNRENERKS